MAAMIRMIILKIEFPNIKCIVVLLEPMLCCCIINY